jgi:hypothetical protein
MICGDPGFPGGFLWSEMGESEERLRVANQRVNGGLLASYGGLFDGVLDVGGAAVGRT